MITLAGAMLAIGAIGGMAKGLVNATSSEIQYQEQIKELQQKSADLNTSMQNATASYNLSVKQAKESAADTIGSYNANIADVTTSRDIALKQGAGTIEQQNAIYNEQLAEVQIAASEAQGQNIQSASMSGFRNSGSTMNATTRSDLAYGRSLKQTEAQRTLSLNQSYQSALNSYTSANMQISGYKRQIQYAQNELSRNLESYDLQYKQNMNSLNTQLSRNEEDIAYMNGTGRTLFNISQFMNMAGSSFSGAANAYSIFGS